MTPIDWATRPLKRYAQFSGRAPRAEFWWYALMVCVAVVVAMIIENIVGLAPILAFYGPLTLAILVATLVPTLAAQTRRLHDTGRSGWWLLAFYVLYVAYTYLAYHNLAAIAAGDNSSLATMGIVSIALFAYAILLIIFYVRKGTSGPNTYGDDPHAGGAARAM